MPGAATYQPPAGAFPQQTAPGAAYPAAGYPATPTYSPGTGGTTPPGGWNGGVPQYQPAAPGGPTYQYPPAGAAPRAGYGVTPTGFQIGPVDNTGGVTLAGADLTRGPEGVDFTAPRNAASPSSSSTTARLSPADSIAAAPRLPIQRLLTDRRDRATQPMPGSVTLSPTTSSAAVQPAGYDAPSTAAARTAPARLGSDGFRPRGSSSGTTTTDNGAFQPPGITRAAVDAAAATPGDPRYGADADHQWLRGQLVLDGATGLMFLQYLPTAADQYGGALPLANPDVLANITPGEFLRVTGQVAHAPRDDGSLMPVFQVSGVQRQ